MDLRQTPRAIDGTPFSAPCLFPSGVYLYIAGAGDDPDGDRGAGQEFTANRSEIGNTTVEWSFNDLVYLAGGGASYVNAELGDWATLEVYAPATAVTPNGGGTGNCNLVDPGVGAAILIVPAAGNGAYDVDLDAAVPVPAQTAEGYNGYWEWDYSLVGRGTISLGNPGTAHFHLLAIEKTLVRFANKLQFLGGGDLDMTLPAVEPKAQLPHWKGRITLHNHNGHANLQTTWFLHTARVLTL